jgi:hypothetical protein
VSESETTSPTTSLVPTRIPEGEPPETYTELGKDYPVALVAGGLAIGLLAGALLPRSLGRRVARSVVAMAAITGEISRKYGGQVINVAGEAGRDNRERGIRFARDSVKFLANLRR